MAGFFTNHLVSSAWPVQNKRRLYLIACEITGVIPIIQVVVVKLLAMVSGNDNDCFFKKSVLVQVRKYVANQCINLIKRVPVTISQIGWISCVGQGEAAAGCRFRLEFMN